MIEEYVARFDEADRERIFNFCAAFARAECALKRGGFLGKGSHGQAEPNWTAFADSIEAAFAGLSNGAFSQAKALLSMNPPKRQVPDNASVRWDSNPRRDSERSEARYILRVMRDVRNNLFHGGKYPNPDGPVADLARDREVIDAAIIVLASSLALDRRVASLFSEAS